MNPEHLIMRAATGLYMLDRIWINMNRNIPDAAWTDGCIILATCKDACKRDYQSAMQEYSKLS